MNLLRSLAEFFRGPFELGRALPVKFVLMDFHNRRFS